MQITQDKINSKNNISNEFNQPTFNISTIPSGSGFTFSSPLLGKGFGSEVANLGDINGDKIDDFAICATNAFTCGNNYAPGNCYITFGNTTFPSELTTDWDRNGKGFIVSGLWNGDTLGTSVSKLGDINGDGFGDFIIGAPFGQLATAYVIYGKNTTFPETLYVSTLNGFNGFSISGGWSFGRTVGGGADINADGINDILINSNSDSYVVYGRKSDFPARLNTTMINGSNGFHISSGCCMSIVGDVNADGIADMGTGSSVIFGAKRFPPTFQLSSLNGNNGFTFSSGQAKGIGDVNGDGIADMGFTNSDAIMNTAIGYIVFGMKGGFPSNINYSALNGNNGFAILNGANPPYNMDSVSDFVSLGDINSDGVGDFAVAAYIANQAESLTPLNCYVIYGTKGLFQSAFQLETLDGSNGFTMIGMQSETSNINQNLFPLNLDTGDFHGNGQVDLLIGTSSGCSGEADYTYCLYF